jgi:hypothetical protein
MGDKRKREDTAETARRVVDATIARSESDATGGTVTEVGVLRFDADFQIIGQAPAHSVGKRRIK